MPPPTTITGGCLCGAIRYELNLGGPSGWPPKVTPIHPRSPTPVEKKEMYVLTE